MAFLPAIAAIASAGFGISQAFKKQDKPKQEPMPVAPTLEDATDKAAKAQDARRRMLAMSGGNTDITQGAGILTNVQKRTLLS